MLATNIKPLELYSWSTKRLQDYEAINEQRRYFLTYMTASRAVGITEWWKFKRPRLEWGNSKFDSTRKKDVYQQAAKMMDDACIGIYQ